MSREKALSSTEKTFKLLDIMPDFCSSFRNHLDAAGTLPSSIYHYIFDINFFLDWLINYSPSFCDKEKRNISTQDIAKVTFEDIDNFLSWYRIKDKSSDSKRSERTLARKKASLSALFTFLCTRKWISNNPVAASGKIKIRTKNLIYLEPEEQESLKNTILYGTGLPKKAAALHEKYTFRDYALTMLLLDTGMRVSEVQGSDIIDYDFDHCNVIVRRKGGNMDTVYFSDEARDALLSYLNSKNQWQSSQDQPMFTTLDGSRLSIRSIEKMIKKYAMAALPQKGKLITPHKMRSTFAMDLYAASGNDILLVKERMAHKSISTTQIYAEARREKIEQSRNFRNDSKKEA